MDSDWQLMERVQALLTKALRSLSDEDRETLQNLIATAERRAGGQETYAMRRLRQSIGETIT